MKNLLKRIMFIILLLSIFQLSNTPNLRVSEPKTWFNSAQYEENLSVQKFFHKDGDFYRPYKNITNKEFILHKISHILFFSILTILSYLNFKNKNRLLYSWIFVVMYATTDEIHQAFIIGRSGRLMDIILDSTASLITILLILLITKTKKTKMEVHPV